MSERQKPKKRNKTANSQPTIGLLTGLLNESSWSAIWAGVADMAREQDVNLICFTGGLLNDPAGFQKQANILYDLVDVEQLDGLIIWGGIGKFVDTQTLTTFYQRYQSIPLVSIGETIADVPGVVADNYGGMYQVITHLVEDHGFHRIAYIKGHENFPEHEERYRAYGDTLNEYGLALDQNLVITEQDTGKPHYTRQIGSQAIKILLDDRQAKFEALVANDDVFVYGVIDELQARGLQAPADMPVMGFNDDIESRYITPPLSTVPYPYYEIGRQATEMLLAQLEGGTGPARVYVPTRLVIRQSCSCLDPAVEQIADSSMPGLMKSFSPPAQQSAGKKIVDVLAQHHEEILAEVEQTLELSLSGYARDAINPAWFEQLLNAFGADLSGAPGVFLRGLDAILRQVVAAGGEVMLWQNAISEFRKQLLPYLDDEEILLRRSEDLWQQARVMIGDFVRRVEGYKTLQAERQSQFINRLGRDLISAPDIPAMMDVLAQTLPQSGIERCYLSLYQNPEQPLAESRLLLAYDKKGRRHVKEAERIFPSSTLAPQAMFRRQKTYSLVVEPLYFREDQQGFVVFEAESGPGELYHALREQISSALQSALSIEKRHQAKQALRGKTEEQEILLDNIEPHIFYLSDPGTYGAVNKAHAEFLGMDKKDLEYKSLDEILGPEMAAICIEANAAIFESKQQLITEEWMVDPNGKRRLFSFVKTPKLDAHNNVEYIICVGSDITESQQVEQSLRTSEAELRSLFAAMTDIVLVLDADGRYLKIAPTSPSYLYRPSDELLGKTLHDVLPSHVADTYLSSIQRVLETGQPVNIEYDLPIDNKQVWFVATISPLPGNQVFWIARDITGRKQAEAALSKRATELEIVTQVSTAALNILDTTELLQAVVDLTKDSFQLYHVHLYLLDDISNKLILAAGAGEVGRHMVSQGWSIPLNREQSLVARAARDRAGVIVNNVQEEPGWLPNKELPHTRSELAVPLLVGERVLGVLDVQSDEVDHFTADDIRIQTTLAAQVAVALENARLFEQAQRTDLLLRERVKEVDCLNDIGREMEENPPPLPQLLEWITQRIPPAMRYPELTLVAIEFAGQVYGKSRAIELPTQIVHGLYIGGEILGRVYIAYTEKRDFIDEESALLGGIATRVSAFIENQRLLEQVNQRAVELEQTTNFLDSIVDNIPVMLFVKDAQELKFMRWNKAGEELVGLKREEMIGKSDQDFFPPEEADFFVGKDREVLTGKVAIDIPEEPINTLYQGTRLLHTRKIPICGPDGEPRYLLGISEDITERKQAEAEREQLLADVQRLAAIVENHPDFIGVGTLEGKPLYLNPAGRQMVGLSLDFDVTTLDVVDFFPAEDAERLLKEGIPTAVENGFWSTEANLLRVDGKIVPVEETVSIHYDTGEKPIAFSITMHDITNRQVAAAEQARLLAEVEASYRQYVRQEWEQYLQEQHQGRWHIEHSLQDMPAAADLSLLQEEVIREQATKTISHWPGNGNNGPAVDNTSESAAIVTPISLRGQVIGTLNLQDTVPDRRWSAEEIALVEAVSEQLALTVENLRLFDDTQRRATREQITRQITDKMHAASDVDAIIQTGLTELAKALDVPRTYVKLKSVLQQAQNSEKLAPGPDRIAPDIDEEITQ